MHNINNNQNNINVWLFHEKENDVAAATSTTTVFCGSVGWWGAGSFGAGAALAPPPPPSRTAIGPKKARDLGPAEKRAPSPYGLSHARLGGGGRSVSLPTPPPPHVQRQRARPIIITIIAAAAAAALVRTIAAARARLLAGRYPSCPVDRRRPGARTRINRRRRRETDPSERVCPTGERSSVVGLRATLPGVEWIGTAIRALFLTSFFACTAAAADLTEFFDFCVHTTIFRSVRFPRFVLFKHLFCVRILILWKTFPKR